MEVTRPPYSRLNKEVFVDIQMLDTGKTGIDEKHRVLLAFLSLDVLFISALRYESALFH